MALQTGQQIGPYQILGPLGQGGMAAVYRAHHLKLDRVVAIKMMHKAMSTDSTFLTRFEREAQIVARLEHPHIVPIYDSAEYEGQPYLVMKFIEGQTLKHVLNAGTLPLPEVSRILGTVANALTYAHQRGVLHRDIKPSNIIIGTDGTPYLTDFGLARMAELGATTISQDMILGTPQYISPEQANGQTDLSPATDVYSLGVILYEMVVGRVPFNADTPYAVVHDHIYSDLPRPSEIATWIPAQVEAVLMKALAKKPADRYESPAVMMQAFDQVCAEAGLLHLPEDRQAQAADSFARRRQTLLDTNPTLTEDRPVIESPLPPAPAQQAPSIRVSTSTIPTPSPTRKVEMEFSFTPENMQKLGNQIQTRIEQGAAKLEEWAQQIEDSTQDKDERESRRERRRREKEDPDAALESRVRKQLKKRQDELVGLIAHAIPFVAVNAMLWGIYLSDGGGFPWPMFVTGGWGIGLFAHFREWWTQYGPGAAQFEAQVQREVAKARGQTNDLEKPKRDAEGARYRLSDDGEIEVIEDDLESVAAKRKRG
jgi:serine/threonine protein kinase